MPQMSSIVTSPVAALRLTSVGTWRCASLSLVALAAVLVCGCVSGPSHSRAFTFDTGSMVFPGASLEEVEWSDQRGDPIGYVGLLFSTSQAPEIVAEWYRVALSKDWAVTVIGRGRGGNRRLAKIAEERDSTYLLTTKPPSDVRRARVHLVTVTSARRSDRDFYNIAAARERYHGPDAITKFAVTVVGHPQ